MKEYNFGDMQMHAHCSDTKPPKSTNFEGMNDISPQF
jgi:hypothetical protein